MRALAPGYLLAAPSALTLPRGCHLRGSRVRSPLATLGPRLWRSQWSARVRRARPGYPLAAPVALTLPRGFGALAPGYLLAAPAALTMVRAGFGALAPATLWPRLWRSRCRAGRICEGPVCARSPWLPSGRAFGAQAGPRRARPWLPSGRAFGAQAGSRGSHLRALAPPTFWPRLRRSRCRAGASARVGPVCARSACLSSGRAFGAHAGPRGFGAPPHSAISNTDPAVGAAGFGPPASRGCLSSPASPPCRSSTAPVCLAGSPPSSSRRGNPC